MIWRAPSPLWCPPLSQSVDYTRDGYGHSLLMDYVRYARDGAADVFENNYRHLLMAMQNDRRVRDFAPEAVPIGE